LKTPQFRLRLFDNSAARALGLAASFRLAFHHTGRVKIHIAIGRPEAFTWPEVKSAIMDAKNEPLARDPEVDPPK
jgi:hypothetical protein